MSAIAVGSYIALAGLIGAPVSGASMNPARSLGPALVLGDWTSWWAYLLGPLFGAVAAIAFAHDPARPGRRRVQSPGRAGHAGLSLAAGPQQAAGRAAGLTGGGSPRDRSGQPSLTAG